MAEAITKSEQFSDPPMENVVNPLKLNLEDIATGYCTEDPEEVPCLSVNLDEIKKEVSDSYLTADPGSSKWDDSYAAGPSLRIKTEVLDEPCSSNQIKSEPPDPTVEHGVSSEDNSNSSVPGGHFPKGESVSSSIKSELEDSEMKMEEDFTEEQIKEEELILDDSGVDIGETSSSCKLANPEEVRRLQYFIDKVIIERKKLRKYSSHPAAVRARIKCFEKKKNIEQEKSHTLSLGEDVVSKEQASYPNALELVRLWSAQRKQEIEQAFHYLALEKDELSNYHDNELICTSANKKKAKIYSSNPSTVRVRLWRDRKKKKLQELLEEDERSDKFLCENNESSLITTSEEKLSKIKNDQDDGKKKNGQRRARRRKEELLEVEESCRSENFDRENNDFNLPSSSTAKIGKRSRDVSRGDPYKNKKIEAPECVFLEEEESSIQKVTKKKVKEYSSNPIAVRVRLWRARQKLQIRQDDKKKIKRRRRVRKTKVLEELLEDEEHGLSENFVRENNDFNCALLEEEKRSKQKVTKKKVKPFSSSPIAVRVRLWRARQKLQIAQDNRKMKMRRKRAGNKKELEKLLEDDENFDKFVGENNDSNSTSINANIASDYPHEVDDDKLEDYSLNPQAGDVILGRAIKKEKIDQATDCFSTEKGNNDRVKDYSPNPENQVFNINDLNSTSETRKFGKRLPNVSRGDPYKNKKIDEAPVCVFLEEEEPSEQKVTKKKVKEYSSSPIAVRVRLWRARQKLQIAQDYKKKRKRRRRVKKTKELEELLEDKEHGLSENFDRENNDFNLPFTSTEKVNNGRVNEDSLNPEIQVFINNDSNSTSDTAKIGKRPRNVPRDDPYKNKKIDETPECVFLEEKERSKQKVIKKKVKPYSSSPIAVRVRLWRARQKLQIAQDNRKMKMRRKCAGNKKDLEKLLEDDELFHKFVGENNDSNSTSIDANIESTQGAPLDYEVYNDKLEDNYSNSQAGEVVLSRAIKKEKIDQATDCFTGKGNSDRVKDNSPNPENQVFNINDLNSTSDTKKVAAPECVFLEEEEPSKQKVTKKKFKEYSSNPVAVRVRLWRARQKLQFAQDNWKLKMRRKRAGNKKNLEHDELTDKFVGKNNDSNSTSTTANIKSTQDVSRDCSQKVDNEKLEDCSLNLQAGDVVLSRAVKKEKIDQAPDSSTAGKDNKDRVKEYFLNTKNQVFDINLSNSTSDTAKIGERSSNVSRGYPYIKNKFDQAANWVLSKGEESSTRKVTKKKLKEYSKSPVAVRVRLWRARQKLQFAKLLEHDELSDKFVGENNDSNSTSTTPNTQGVSSDYQREVDNKNREDYSLDLQAGDVASRAIKKGKMKIDPALDCLLLKEDGPNNNHVLENNDVRLPPRKKLIKRKVKHYSSNPTAVRMRLWRARQNLQIAQDNRRLRKRRRRDGFKWELPDLLEEDELRDEFVENNDSSLPSTSTATERANGRKSKKKKYSTNPASVRVRLWRARKLQARNKEDQHVQNV